MSVQEPTTAAPLNGLLKLQSAVPASEDSSNILIVEDEEALARSMQRILKSRGIAVDTAFSGAEARERLAAGSYAVVLLDVRLPDESGYGLLGELRALRPDIAVVMVSGVDDPELGKAAAGLAVLLRHGASEVIMKWRSAIGERGQRRVALEPEEVLDGGVRRAFEATVSEHVGADLGEGALEEHHIGVVDSAPGPLTKAADRVVESV